jgi:hypothetical protein
MQNDTGGNVTSATSTSTSTWITESFFGAFLQLSYYARTQCGVSYDTWYEQLLLVLLVFPAYMPSFLLVLSWAASVCEALYRRVLQETGKEEEEDEAASATTDTNDTGCLQQTLHGIVTFLTESETRCLSIGSSLTAILVGCLHPVYAADPEYNGCGDDGTATPSLETAIASFAVTYSSLRFACAAPHKALETSSGLKQLQFTFAFVPPLVALARVYIGFCTPLSAGVGAALGVIIASEWHAAVCRWCPKLPGSKPRQQQKPQQKERPQPTKSQPKAKQFRQPSTLCL